MQVTEIDELRRFGIDSSDNIQNRIRGVEFYLLFFQWSQQIEQWDNFKLASFGLLSYEITRERLR